MLLHPIGAQGGWLAPFEAVSALKPVIVSPEMSAADMVRKHNLGIVTEDYEQYVMDIYDNRQIEETNPRAAREWVSANLSWERFCEQMVSVFEEQ